MFNVSAFSKSLHKTRTSEFITLCGRHYSQAAVSIKISNLLLCLCSFELSCPILEKYNFIERSYIELSY